MSDTENGSTAEASERKRFSTATFPAPGTVLVTYTKGNGELAIDVSAFSEEVQAGLAAFGLNVYLSRSRDGDDYASVKANDAAVVTALHSGEFNPGEGRATTGGVRISDLADAAAKVLGADRDGVHSKLLAIYKQTVTTKDSSKEEREQAKKSRKILAGYEDNEQVAAELARIRSARAARENPVDLSALA